MASNPVLCDECTKGPAEEDTGFGTLCAACLQAAKAERAEVDARGEPAVWLSEYEAQGTADCGCILDANYAGMMDVNGDLEGVESPALFYCALHESAADLLETLRGLIVATPLPLRNRHQRAAFERATALVGRLDAVANARVKPGADRG